MGRKRKIDRGWPKGWYLKRTTIYFRLAKYRDVLGDKPIRLGLTEKEAYKRFSELPIYTSDAEGCSLEDAILKYEREVMVNNATRTRENKTYYLKDIRKAAAHFQVADLEQHHAWSIFEAVKQKRGLKTARETNATLRHIMSCCVKWGWVKTNLLLGMRIEKPKHRRRYVTDDEYKLFYDKYATKRVQAHLAIKLETGMDKQDILLIELTDIKPEGLHQRRGKTTAKEKVYGWTPELRAAVVLAKQAYKGKVGSLFLCHAREGNPYYPKNLKGAVVDEEGHPFGAPSGWSSQWSRCMQKWKADGHEGFHEHDIRKKVSSDTDLENAQKLLDHTDPRITETIYRVKPEVVKIRARKFEKKEK